MSERWRRLSAIYHDALARSVVDRDEFLRDACGSDDTLRAEVASLLAHDGSADRAFGAELIVQRDLPGEPAGALLGQQIGFYTVLSSIASGGMGAVYRARDSKLGRDVAIKVLPSEFTADPERAARFEREARVLASLNHPNIASIYGIEEAGDTRALILELVEGETLADIIARGPVPVDRALGMARAVAAALGAAHRKGIVHRDLKPSNIGLTGDGVIKVLDFGLAKAVTPGVAGAGAPLQSTLTRGSRQLDVLLGTPAYMSPEQARGKVVDARSDLWAFGCVLYEMLTGRAAFSGESITDVLAAVVEHEPDWNALPRSVPPAVRDVLRRCLMKEPVERVQSISDAVAVLDDGLSRTSATTRPGRLARWRVFGPAATITVALFWLGVEVVRRPGGAPDLLPVPLTSLPGVEEVPSFSPDGTRVAFSWNGKNEDNFDIYVKPVGEGDPVRLTANPARDYYPAWSPDGNWIGFSRSINATSGPRWFVHVVPQMGGVERPVAPGMLQGWSPDSASLLVTRGAGTGTPGLVLISLDTGRERQLTSSPLGDLGSIAPDGSAMAIRRNVGPTSIATLLVQPLSNTVEPAGDPRMLPVDPRIRLGLAAPVSWTANAREIIYAAGWGGSYLWRIPADGTRGPQRLTFAGVGALMPTVSRDGRRLAYSKLLSDWNIWSLPLDATGNVERQPVSAFSSTLNEWCPAFSPDGRWVAFESNRSGQSEIYTCASDGTQCATVTSFNGPHVGSPAWSPDGSMIAFDGSAADGSDIYMVRASGGPPIRVASGAAPRWSRDGQWIYYSSRTTQIPVPHLYRVHIGRGEPQLIEGTTTGWIATETADGSLYYSDNPNADRATIRRIPKEGGTFEEVLSDVAGRNFVATPTGIWYFAASRPNQPNVLYFYDFASKQPRRVWQSARPVFAGMSVSPDGRHLLFTQIDRQGSDLMLVENFR